MTTQEIHFHSVSEKLEEAVAGKLFGKLCYKIKGKAFVCFFQNEMVFKLNSDKHSEALSLDGSQLFDPSGKGRPMKEWVQVSYDDADRWSEFAASAYNYVSSSVK